MTVIVGIIAEVLRVLQGIVQIYLIWCNVISALGKKNKKIIRTTVGAKPVGSGELDMYVTNPAHGGKVTCHKCGGFISHCDWVPYRDYQHQDDFPNTHFHTNCYNQYEHYYGLDKPID